MVSLKKSEAPNPPTEIEMMSTPSAIASSKAAKISSSTQSSGWQILYVAILALGTHPFAVPSASPKKLISFTMFPAAIEAV